MKPPPFLLGAALLFWGWQTDFVLPAMLMALILESPRWTKLRWELGDEDFSRIWIFCTLLFLASAIYAFTANEGPADFRGLFENPGFLTQRNAGASSAKTAAAMVRWLPMIFFFFMAAQVYSAREGIPMETISLILRRRWRRARKAGLPTPPSQVVNISYPYFAICLFAACVHNREDGYFFWGLCALLAWALWSQRCRRFSVVLWAVLLTLAIALGYGGQRGISHLQRYLETLNAQWLVGFARRDIDPGRNRTALGQIGSVKTSGKIVIRLETKPQVAPPPLLREASYRTFKVHTWYSGSPKSEETIVASQTNPETWVLLANKTNTASVQIACYLETGKRFGGNRTGLLPLASGSGQLDHLPAYLLYKNQTGGVRAEGPGLVMFEDRYGEGETIDSPPEREDNLIPDKEKAAVEQVVAELGLAGKSMEQKVSALKQFFQNEFSYRTWQDRDRSSRIGETPLARFLLRTRKGHCEYFATATVLLLRQLEIPARYAIGYAVHENSGNQYVIRQRDGHAWCIYWDETKKIWRDFDTTPASWVKAEARHSIFQSLSDAWSRLKFEIAKLRWGHSHIRQYLLWFLAPVLGVLLFQIISRSRRRREEHQDRMKEPAWPGLDSEFYQLERRIASFGLGRQKSEPLSEWLERSMRQPAVQAAQYPLQELLRLHYRYRFDPQGLSVAERRQLRSTVQECLAKVQRPE
jgi:transglutaminase-like putative cysteine protease